MSEIHNHGHIHENQKAVINRLARAIGHLNKVKRMVEEGYDCTEVLVQLAAVRSAIDNTGKVILNDHIRHCMVDAVQLGDESAIDGLCDAVEKFYEVSSSRSGPRPGISLPFGFIHPRCARLSPTSVMASVPKSRGHDSFSLEGEAFGGNLY